jgi:hypothetical protein
MGGEGEEFNCHERNLSVGEEDNRLGTSVGQHGPAQFGLSLFFLYLSLFLF